MTWNAQTLFMHCRIVVRAHAKTRYLYSLAERADVVQVIEAQQGRELHTVAGVRR